MTDAMTVQGQQSSNPGLWALGGAGLGLAGGATAGHYGYGINTQYASNWEDAVKKTNEDDKFVKSAIEKGGDNKSNWEAIQKHAKAVQEAEKAVNEFKFPEGFNAKAELEAMWKAQEAYDNKLTEAYDTALKKLKEMEIKEDSPFEWNGKKYNQKEFRELLSSSKDEDKKLVKEIVEGHKEYTDIINKDGFRKTEKEALDRATETFNGKKGDKWTQALDDSYKALREKAATARKEASSGLGDDILKACKKPSTLWTALAAAAVLGIGGYLVGKSKNNA